jgi:DNA-binding MarR family transcriptional regulator
MSALATECIVHLGWLRDEIDARSHALTRRHGIPSPAAFQVLAILDAASAPLKPSSIAHRMRVTRPTMTGIVRSLIARRLVRLRPNARDRRSVWVELTPVGSARVRKLRPALQRAQTRWMSCLGESQQRTLLRLVASLHAHLPRA